MRVEIFSNNLIQVNTYFIIKDNKCLLIDPGSNAKKILKFINDECLEVEGVVLTHAHFDHFYSANEILLTLNVPLYVHSKGVEALYDPDKNISSAFRAIIPLKLDKNILVSTINEETRQIGSFKLRVFHVPGHSPCGICLYFPEEKMVFSGDSLFKLSIGRTDFYNGNEEQLLTNIKNKLLRLPEDTIVYPGHGPKTTIGYEIKNNLYIR
ncbi:MAG TPA: MBL fold metallo-hydrolase [Haloplasmataceae bacterium]